MSSSPAPVLDAVENFFSRPQWAPLYRQESLDELASTLKLRYYHPGDQIVEQGARPSTCLFIVEGKIEVKKKGLRGERFVAETPPGRTVCEQSFFDFEPAGASCYAKDKVALLLLDREDYDALALRHPQTALILTQLLAAIISQRLRNVMGKLSELSEGFGIR
ncbi:MAG: cyclic nucleotide-binding domain-containing protein [Myxococcota bacterium]|nr:cyclic nucleotide-binding domain-containing protein [Myxococcota bacterium]